MKNQQHKREINKNIRDKDKALRTFQRHMLNKTGQIFEYKNLPDSIPDFILERSLQKNGNVFFYEHEGSLYVFTGGMGGPPDVYYQPTLYTIANPALNISVNATIGKDGVLLRNDSHMEGLLPIIYKYGAILTEMDISILNAVIATRDYNAISARSDRERQSALEYLRQVEAGELGIIHEAPLKEAGGITRHPGTSGARPLADLKETYQYIKSLLYSDLGLKTASNMKSQYVSDEENIINDDSLLPLIDNMLECRKRGLNEVNELFGTNIEVELRGTWKLQSDEVEVAIKHIEEVLNSEESESNEETGAGISVEGDGEQTEVEAAVEEINDETAEEESNIEETVEGEDGEHTVEVNVEINLSEESDDNVVGDTEESDDKEQH